MPLKIIVVTFPLEAILENFGGCSDAVIPFQIMYQYAVAHYKTTRGIVVTATEAFEKDLNNRANEAWESHQIVPFSEDHLMVVYRRATPVATEDVLAGANVRHHQ